jgi:putative transcriptional regulator
VNAVHRSLLVAALTALLSSGAPTAVAQEPPLANGVFLVAKPELLDPNFRETVVLITQPEIGGGPVGVIVNRPIAARLTQALPQIGAVPERYEQIYGGGPVMPNGLLFLVRTSERISGGWQVLADVYLSGDLDVLRKVIAGELKVDTVRAYAGYAGWAPGQLQNEIQRGGWYVIKADADTIFAADVSRVWPDLIEKLATRHTRLEPDGLKCASRHGC